MNESDSSSRRRLFEGGEMRIGEGEIGGKANGLVFFKAMLEAEFDPSRFPEIATSVPPFAVLATGVFDAFMEGNGLYDLALSERPDEEIAQEFQNGTVPEAVVGELAALLDVARSPLAIRSSSLMEDAIFRPFAGVYETKMLSNNQPEPAERLAKAIESVPFSFARANGSAFS